MLAKGWIKPRVSPYSSPVLFIPNKTGEFQIYIDFCELNATTKSGASPLPHIADNLHKLGKAKYFSRIDLAIAYF